MKSFYYQDYLKNELSERININPRYSLRSFAKSLKIDAGDLSRILNGTKVLTPELARKILGKLSLSRDETEDFMSSIAEAYEKKGVLRKSSGLKSIMLKAKNKNVTKDIGVDVFKVISDWYHFAILQLIETENFVNDTKWIAKQLSISEMEVTIALKRLLSLDLLKEEGGKLLRTSEIITTGDRSITSSALRKRIKQISEKSVHSLENDPIEIRNHTTMTMSIDPDKIPMVKEMIQDFMDKLEATLQTNKRHVYELQINLFPLQRGSHENK